MKKGWEECVMIKEKKIIELAESTSEELIKFSMSEWEDEYDRLEQEIFNKKEELEIVREKILIWKKVLEIKMGLIE